MVKSLDNRAARLLFCVFFGIFIYVLFLLFLPSNVYAAVKYTWVNENKITASGSPFTEKVDFVYNKNSTTQPGLGVTPDDTYIATGVSVRYKNSGDCKLPIVTLKTNRALFSPGGSPSGGVVEFDSLKATLVTADGSNRSCPYNLLEVYSLGDVSIQQPAKARDKQNDTDRLTDLHNAICKAASNPTGQAKCNAAGKREIKNDKAKIKKAIESMCSPRNARGLCLDYYEKYNPSALVSADPSEGTNPDDISCSDAEGALNWILCPVTEALEKGINVMDNWINNMLTISTGRIFCTQTSSNCNDKEVESGKNFYTAWKSFRNIALGIIVIASLVVIISTALGFEFLDAYTIRKVLPRVLLSIIFITLSWSVLEFLVVLSNDVGNGVRALIYAPFSSMDGVTLSANFGINLLLGGSLVAYAVAGPGLMALLTFAFTAFLAIMIAFLVMMLRELIVILLILLAPIGIACLILPNTQKGWQLWQNTLWVMLIAFTIISAMIATGRVFAITITNTNDGVLIYKLMALAAYVLPYFMLPFAFRLAGGMIGTLAGLANDRSRGAFDRLKNYRNRKAGENWDKTKNFSRYPDKGPLKGVNTAMGALANPTSMLRGRKGVATTQFSKQKAYGAQYLKDSDIFQANQGDDAFLLALASRKHAIKRRDAALKRSEDTSLSADDRYAARMDAENYTNALNAAAQIGFRGQTNAVRSQALTALTKTGYQFASGQEGYDELSEIVQDIAGSPEGIHAGTYSQLMDEAQYHLKGAGRSEFAGINHGAKLNIKSGIRKLSNYQRGQGKPATYQGGAEAWLGVNSNNKTTAEIANSAGDALASGKTTTQDVLEWQRMLIDDYGSATDGNKLEIQKQLDAIANISIPMRGDVPEEEYVQFTNKLQENFNVHQSRLQGTRPVNPNEIENN